jgi:hypothetical protein
MNGLIPKLPPGHVLKSLLGFCPSLMLYFENITKSKGKLVPASICGSVELSHYCFAQYQALSKSFNNKFSVFILAYNKGIHEWDSIQVTTWIYCSHFNK